MHLLKYKYQLDKRSNSWLYTIREHRRRIIRSLQDSPRLNPYLSAIFNNCYQYARQETTDETGLPVNTFPLNSPFTLENTLNFEFLPDENDKNI